MQMDFAERDLRVCKGGGGRGKLRGGGAAGTLSFPRTQGQPHPESQPHSLVAGCSCSSISVGPISLKIWEVKNPLADSAINPGFPVPC